ncbi:MAG: hypothetical protein QNJ81_02350 [Acidimicrobiia bacterium]|nr:hypothetical protein [Acidimicrobiia bacterium]
MDVADPWVPMAIDEVLSHMAGAPFRWWLSGGHALEMHVGHSWREHEDTDLGLVRGEVDVVFEWFAGWSLAVAARGTVSEWDGRPLADGENNIWARRRDEWEIDLTIGDGTDDEWVYRRDPTVRRPWRNAVLYNRDGVPYLAPDVQLLFKSKAVRPKDDVDAGRVIPALSWTEKAFLRDNLAADHVWQRLLAAADSG